MKSKNNADNRPDDTLHDDKESNWKQHIGRKAVEKRCFVMKTVELFGYCMFPC